jgi:hypothetical protein
MMCDLWGGEWGGGKRERWLVLDLYLYGHQKINPVLNNLRPLWCEKAREENAKFNSKGESLEA